jgi:DNA-directed RNA polymerase specialized sigma54-like protein
VDGWNEAAIPELRLHQLYVIDATLARRRIGAMAGQLQEAKWLIKNASAIRNHIAGGAAIVER